MMKSRMRWTGHAAGMGEKKCLKFWSENLKESCHLENLVVDRRMI
jgi:hypothetical protein